MQPIEIDIRMRQNVSEESKKAADSVRGLGDGAKMAQDELLQSITIQKKVLAELRKELATAEKDFQKVNIGTQDPKLIKEREKLSKIFHQLRYDVKMEEEALKALEKQQETYTAKTTKISTEISNLRNEMAKLKIEGKENTQEYRTMEAQLELLGTAYKELGDKQRALSAGTTHVEGLISGFQGLSGVFATAVGSMGMFNDSSQEMEKIQTRLQASIGMLMGLQEIANTLDETSAFRTTTVRKAKELWAIANMKVATTLGITNVQAQILMATVTLGLSVAITAAVVVIDKYITKKRKAAEITKKFKASVADTATDVIVKYRKMREEWDALGDSFKEKQKYINANKSAFEELGVAVTSIADAENLLVNRTEAYKNAMMERAKSAAYTDVAAEKYRTYIKQLNDADERELKPSNYEKTVRSKKWYTRNGRRVLLNVGAVEAAEKMRKKAKKDLEDFEKFTQKSVEKSNKAKEILKKNGFNATDVVAEGTKRYWEEQKANAEAALELLKDTEKGTAKWNEQVKKLKKAEKALEAWDFSDKKESTTKTVNKRENNLKRLAKIVEETEREANELALAAMKDGREKKLKEIDNEYERRRKRIQKRRKELRELEEDLGIDVSEQYEKLTKNEAALLDWRKKQKNAVNTAYNNEVTKKWKELLDKYKTYENKKTEILEKYSKDRAKLEAKNQEGKYDDNIAKLNKLEAEELFVLEKTAGNVKSTIAEVFSDLSGKSVAELKKIQGKAEGLLAFLESGNYTQELGQEYGIEESVYKSISANPESLKAIRDVIVDIRKKTKGLKEHLQTLFNKKPGQEDFEESLGVIANKLQGVTQLTNLLSSALSNLAELSGSGVFGSIASELSSITEVASSVMSGAQAGLVFGPVGAAIGAGLGLVSSITGKLAEAERKHREALNNIRKAELAQQQEYNRLLFEQKKLMKDKESIFGTDEIAKAVGYLALYNESFQQLQAKFKKKAYRSFNMFKGFSTDFLSELDKIKIKTGHKKTGLFGWGKGKDIYSSITSQYPDLIKANGEFNRQRAEALLKEQQFAKGSKEALQEIINLYDQAQESEKLFNDYLQNTFGELGSGIIDSVINALKTGEDAFETFADSVGNVMGRLGKQIMYELFVSSKFKDFQKQLRSIVRNGDVYKYKEFGMFSFRVKDEEATVKNVAKKMRDAVGNFANEMKSEMEYMKMFAEIWQKETKGMGFDVWQNEEGDKQRTAASKGIAQASQDSIDEVLGRLNALIRFVNEQTDLERLGINFKEQNIGIQTAILNCLNAIAENTEYNKFLEELAEDIREIKEQGLKMKM